MNGVHTRCGLWLLVFSIACGPRGGDAGGRTETASSHASLEAMGVPCRDRLEDVTRPLGGRAPGRGGLVACVPEVVYGRDEATRRAIRSGYSGPPLERSIVSYRIAYGTERLDGQPGVSTARVYLPIPCRKAGCRSRSSRTERWGSPTRALPPGRTECRSR